MTSRERVLKAINHQEPDRVPIDLGSSIMSGIMAQALDRLRKHLGLEDRPVKVYELFQMLGEVEMDVVERLEIDVLPVEPPIQFFGLRRENYKPWRLFDGTEVLVPGQFEVEEDSNGDYLLHDQGDKTRPVEARMPNDGYYFDKVGLSDIHPDFVPPPLTEIKKLNHLATQDLEFLQAKAERLRATTDKALLLGCWGRTGLGSVGSIPDFLCLLATDQAYVKDLFAIQTETAIRNMENLKRVLGGNIDIIGLDGGDYGSQRGELFSPDWFEDLFVPYYRELNDWVHTNTSWKTWKHTCGSVAKIMPMLVEAGLDVINPVQCSAAGMDPRWLKDTFGERITFWGGSVDTQKTLPFGTPGDVIAEVTERIAIFAPGGGYVFNPVHNVQHGTPPENLLAAYETARKVGGYPISV
jgi:hypothetical protein